MKYQIGKILIISVIIAAIGLMVDTDQVELSMMIRVIEFFAMIGLIFFILYAIYFIYNQLFRYIKNV